MGNKGCCLSKICALPSGQRYQLWSLDPHAEVSPVISFTVADARQPQWLPFVLPIEASAVVQLGISASNQQMAVPNPAATFC